MITRDKTRQIKVGNLTLGGQNKVLIQSMCTVKTEHIDEVVKELEECQKLGADLMRLAVIDRKDAEALKEIKKRVSIPLVADIQFDPKMALLSLEYGADAVRINPGNLKESDILEIGKAAKEKGIPLRIGLNGGSIEKECDIEGLSEVDKLLKSCQKCVGLLESIGFYDICISIKCSSVKETIQAYERVAKDFNYPLHLGLTEAGIKDVSLIRSSAALSKLLLEGLGDTIRVSITGSCKDEIIAAKELLHDLDLYPDYPTLISCPTCGRTEVDVIGLSKQVYDLLQEINKPITVAVMGCVVNGPGEAKNADIGLTGNKDEYIIFKKDKIIRRVKEKDALNALREEILKL
ncbi:MAG: flavodoxin-dependent (E)-4-hydroxy-3-methylbut-2-enyl-diphosphate synthase [Coprobacillus sp.]|nr:flavodoxin-dependent (E)-4-hydroxy-3-methylbut-2-enyl-diphosphate synthase [Coprobacillus sp.]